ncbi:hypothetical protein OESDEN_18003 [Oesophagostomum dentatum]|uniref:Uncharacterized protein n=1 Tax=Oesophagostomum dentatum TaxID=61180 RepID=A0A0B1SBK0_OESDE|nr:hypothetical protein OESDEN_18003 [Oesophagostomum dentatum]
MGGYREARRGNAYLCCLTVPPKSLEDKKKRPNWLERAASKVLDVILDTWVDFSLSIWSKFIVGGTGICIAAAAPNMDWQNVFVFLPDVAKTGN